MLRTKAITLAALSLFLCACQFDPSLSEYDRNMMWTMKRYGWGNRHDDIIYKLLEVGPTKTAEMSAQKQDYGLIGFVGANNATNIKHPDPFVVNCTVPVKIIPESQGCVPSPTTYYKLLYLYNAAMIQQPGFPQKDHCTIDPRAFSSFEKAEEAEKISFKEEARERIIQWEHEYKKSHSYNN